MPTTAELLASALGHYRNSQRGQTEQICRLILTQQPDHTQATNLLGVVAHETGRIDEAIGLLRRVTAAEPANNLFRANLGAALLTAGRFDESRYELEQSLRRDSSFADAHYNLGVVLNRLGRLDDAAESYRRCLRLNPHFLNAHNNLGTLLRELGQNDEALVHLEKVLAVDNQAPSAHFNRSLIWLGQGRLVEGFQEYEWRWRCGEFNVRQSTKPAWDGSPLTDETLLIRSEQGLGDTIQFIRYLPAVRQRCPRVVVEVQPSLIPIFEQSGIRDLLPQRSALPQFEVQVPMVTVARLFGTTVETIPAPVPYLTAQPELVAAWGERLSRYSGLKVGIAWQGSLQYREDRFRSIPLPFFAPLARQRGVQLVSLQKGPGIEQLPLLRGAFHVVDLGTALDDRAGPFMDTAAIMKNLDLIITSDTVTAHLAGALGVRVWLALSFAPDWRWLLGRSDSPWYPTMRLFRQPELGNWHGVFQQMASELAHLAGR